ncbi:MAG TPA: T9SS type A sorting domain-containing protein [Bacteroidia bacterium]|jgi:hypothetical protein|nr:T9SS type A sorting domain-containing protein [Bacteroidia bacterium]
MKKLLLLIPILFSFYLVHAQCTSCLIPFVSSSQATGSSTSVTIPAPAGITPNNILIAAIHSGWCQGGSVTPPAGWTLIGNTSNTGSGCGSGNTTPQLSTFYKIAGSSEPASYTFTGTTTQLFVGGIVAYSGVDVVNPLNAASNNGNQDSCGAIRAASVTTTNCTRIVTVFFCSVNNWVNNIVPQASLTERVDVGNTGNHPWGNENLEISDQLMTSTGATGGRVAALNGCNSDGWVTGAQMIALNCDLALDVADPALTEEIQLMPNPSNGTFELVLPHVNACKYQVVDALGNVVREGMITQEHNSFDLSEEAKGIYFLELSGAQGTVVRKIVIR